MNKTNIEWVKNPDGTQGYTWNPITGCLKGCEYCYAKKLADTRLRGIYLNNKNIAPANRTIDTEVTIKATIPFYPRFWTERATRTGMVGKGKPDNKGIFVCDMSDLFGIGIPEEWTNKVLSICRAMTHHRFYLLTKQPQNLPKFSPFPENCWVGVTATNLERLLQALTHLENVEAKVKYISVEPFIEWDYGFTIGYLTNCIKKGLLNFGAKGWLIIGACTGTAQDLKPILMKYPSLPFIPYSKKWTLQPKIEWVQEIVEAADKVGIPVFLKDNLLPLIRPLMRVPNLSWFGNVWGLRQEFPK